MYSYLPFEIQLQIIERLPIRSLIQFRSVSKSWKSLIESYEFIASYSVRHNQLQRLLIRYQDPRDSNGKYLSIVDDNTFPRQMYAPTIPLFVKRLKSSTIVGSCQGLLCLYGNYVESPEFQSNMAVIWNPSIRKSVAVTMPNVLEMQHKFVLGFGICPDTSDPKIIHLYKDINMRGMIDGIPWQVRVFTLSSGTWRSLSSNLPRSSITFAMPQSETVVIDRFIYWSVCDKIDIDGRLQNYKLVMSFDLINGEFREVYLPDSLARNAISTMSIFKLRESFVVIENGMQSYVVWMMEHGVQNSFTRLFSIDGPDALSINWVLGFRKTGELILEVKNDRLVFVSSGLAIYDSYSEDIYNIGIIGYGLSFFVKSYTETLLLLNQPEAILA